MHKKCSTDGCTNQAQKGEYVSDMVHLVSQQSAAMKGAPILLGKEEYVGDMVQWVEFLNFAAMKDAPTKSRREGYVVGMVPALCGRYVQLKGVPTNSRRKEFVVGTVRSKEVYLQLQISIRYPPKLSHRTHQLCLVDCYILWGFKTRIHFMEGFV